MTASERSPLTGVWLAVSSVRTTALLAILLALFAGVAALVPQGWPAIELARLEHAEIIQKLAAWGLTNVFDSPWIRALGVILLVNVAAVVARSRMSKRLDQELVTPPRGAPFQEELKAPLPERAVEALRESFRAALSTAPVAEQIEGSRVTMVFDTSQRSEIAPLMAHLGLVLLVVGAGLSVHPPPRQQAVVHAVLDVRDSRTGTVGHFDMVSGEPFQFFQWRAHYTVRDYVVDKDGLGPAIRMEQRFTDSKEQPMDFWVYQNAPADFDRRHRQDVVSIEARRMGIVPLPGSGLASRPSSFLLIAGLGLIVFGALAGNRPRGRLWLEANGDEVRLTGVPHHAGDKSFQGGFTRWSLLARAALES